MSIFANQNYGWAEQDKSAVLDYSEDWSDFLSDGDSILSSVWGADQVSVALTNPSISGPITTVFVGGGSAGMSCRIVNTITTLQGRTNVRFFTLKVTDIAAAPAITFASALFDRFRSVQEFKTESLAFLDGSFPVTGMTDDYLWSNLLSAEQKVAHDLRVFLAPTLVVPYDTPKAELDAMKAAGTRFAVDSVYDYNPSDWSSGSWGMMKLHYSPVISVEAVNFVYPNPTSYIMRIPDDWLRLDGKYGTLQFVPSGSTMSFGPMSTYLMGAMSGGRKVPGLIQVHYTAGLEDAATTWPDLVTLVKRMAILNIMKSAFLPQSASISADGMSQSNSIDADKWQTSLENDIDTLRDAIHGIRFGVF
jgi:hypothetical protein